MLVKVVCNEAMAICCTNVLYLGEKFHAPVKVEKLNGFVKIFKNYAPVSVVVVVVFFF